MLNCLFSSARNTYVILFFSFFFKVISEFLQKVGKETDPEYEFGETAFTHTSPFLGSLAPGQGLQSLENNLYRAPIYKHSSHSNDFLLIRTKQG